MDQIVHLGITTHDKTFSEPLLVFRKAGDTDILSQYQRAPDCLGVSNLVAKDRQSKGKIECHFGFWQKRLPALFAMDSVSNRTQANELLAIQIHWHHQNHVSRNTGLTPQQAVEKSILEASTCWRPTPPTALLLLDAPLRIPSLSRFQNQLEKSARTVHFCAVADTGEMNIRLFRSS